MSTPLFTRTPTVGSGIAPILGASLAAYDGSTTMADLTGIVDEPTLIEDISWSAWKFSTQVGMLILAISDGTHRRLVGTYQIAAGDAALIASDRIAVNITIPTGYKLSAAHNVKDGGSAFTNLDVVPHGGIVR